MTYDLHGPMDSLALHHSALYAGDHQKEEATVFNQVSFNWKATIIYVFLCYLILVALNWIYKDWVVNYLINNMVPPEKLILGIALYGKSFKWTSDARVIGM